MENKEKNFVSAVVYLHDCAAAAEDFFAALDRELGEHFEHYELVAVDDCCTDDTVARLRSFAAGLAHPLTILHMSIAQGVEQCMNAGLDAAIGDYVFEFDSVTADCPLQLLWPAYQTAMQGNDIVTVCPDKSPLSSRLFYGIFNANSRSAYRLRTDVFRLVSRRAINRVHAVSENLPYRKAAYAASGLRMTSLDYSGAAAPKQKGRLDLALDSLVLYTDAGWRLSIGIAMILMLAAVAELVYTVVFYLCGGQPIEGWTTIMFVLTFGFTGVFAVLAILLKYLSILLNIIFRQQKYLVESVEKIQK